MKQPALSSAEFQRNPFQYWAYLREHHPVHQVRLPDGRRSWLVTRYPDVLRTLKDSRFLKDPMAAKDVGSKPPWMPSFLRPLSRNMLDLDGRDHERLRRLVHHAFTPRRVDGLRTRITTVTHDLLDRIPDSSTIDLVSTLALPLPVTIIAELLGIPAEDHSRFHAWTQRVVSVASPTGIVCGLPAILQFMRYIRKLISVKRRAPQDDLLSALIAAEEDGDSLSEDELVGMIVLLLIAGHETTVNLISCGTLTLLENPVQLERLRDEPVLIKTAVEELARFISPVSIATERYAVDDIEIAGVGIRRGDQVLSVLSSANRDPSEFKNADDLDIAREPNRHVSFGQGMHYCIGAPLARMEVQIAIEALLQRAPHIALNMDPQKIRWRHGLFLRGVRSLRVRMM